LQKFGLESAYNFFFNEEEVCENRRSESRSYSSTLVKDMGHPRTGREEPEGE